jgi:hypothetical protein
MTAWSQFHSAGQDGFKATKEDVVTEIREWVLKCNSRPSGTMETLERMSKRDLDTLVWAIRETK